MAHPIMFDEDDPYLARMRELCGGFPGAEEIVSHGRPCFRAGKLFLVFGGSEKIRPGEHRQVPAACQFKADPAELPALDADERFFVPMYMGPSGWRGIDLADPRTDETEVAELVDTSYRLVAPRRLVAEHDRR